MLNSPPTHPIIANRTMLNIITPRVVAKGESVLCLVIILDPFSGRSHITINDAATLADANEANAVCMIFPVDCVIGLPIEVFAKVRRGITVSKIPRNARIVLTYHVKELESDWVEGGEAVN